MSLHDEVSFLEEGMSSFDHAPNFFTRYCKMTNLRQNISLAKKDILFTSRWQGISLPKRHFHIKVKTSYVWYYSLATECGESVCGQRLLNIGLSYCPLPDICMSLFIPACGHVGRIPSWSLISGHSFILRINIPCHLTVP